MTVLLRLKPGQTIEHANTILRGVLPQVREALRALQAFEMNSEALDCLEEHGKLMQVAGQTENAVRTYAAGSSIREALAVARSAPREAELQARLRSARAGLGGDAFDIAWKTGRRWSMPEAIEHALRTSTGAPVVA